MREAQRDASPDAAPSDFSRKLHAVFQGGWEPRSFGKPIGKGVSMCFFGGFDHLKVSRKVQKWFGWFERWLCTSEVARLGPVQPSF